MNDSINIFWLRTQGDSLKRVDNGDSSRVKCQPHRWWCLRRTLRRRRRPARGTRCGRCPRRWRCGWPTPRPSGRTDTLMGVEALRVSQGSRSKCKKLESNLKMFSDNGTLLQWHCWWLAKVPQEAVLWEYKIFTKTDRKISDYILNGNYRVDM